MTDIICLWVPITALICYLLLFVALWPASDNLLMRTFCRQLLCLIIWTGASVLTLLYLYLKHPKLEILLSGSSAYHYPVDWWILFPIAVCLTIFILALRLIWRKQHKYIAPFQGEHNLHNARLYASKPPAYGTAFDRQALTSTIYAITAAINAKDHYTFSHSQNVANYARTLAAALGLDDFHVQLMYQAGLVHDVGKLAIPEHILLKPGYLTPDERQIMQSHAESSIPIIRNLPFPDYLLPAVVTHHERWDGNGYPRGLSKDDIPLGGRCLALADAFDAITSKRTYKTAYSTDYAVREIKKGAGTQFDPALCPVFIRLIEQGMLCPKA